MAKSKFTPKDRRKKYKNILTGQIKSFMPKTVELFGLVMEYSEQGRLSKVHKGQDIWIPVVEEKKRSNTSSRIQNKISNEAEKPRSPNKEVKNPIQ